MPAVVLGPIIGAAIAGGTTIAATKMNSNAARRAGEQNAASIDQQMDFEREQAAEDKRRYDETQALNRQRYDQARDEEQRRYAYERDLEASRFNAEQARRTPYRQVSVEQLNDLNARTVRGNTLADLARR